jgi:preprotein translocase subunit YajC
MTMALQDIVYNLESWGLTDVLLPFLLVFVIVFAVLQKSQVLGKDRKNFNVVVALVMALGVIIPHVTGRYPPGKDVVEIINVALPNISIVLVAVIMLLIILGVFASELTFAGTTLSEWGGVFAIFVVVYVFGSAAEWWSLPAWANFLRDPETQTLLIVILVFAIIIWFITKEDDKDKKGIGEHLKSIGDVLGKK